MELYSQDEKLELTIGIVKKLKFYECNDGQIIDLYKDSYSYVPILKKVFNDYIKGETEFKGQVFFEELGKKIEYRLPIYKKYNPLFVIRT